MKKIGFVLEGGGVRGAYQCGALKAMEECGIRPSVITGTSIGALNGALFALGKMDRLLELYENFDAAHYFNLDEAVVEQLYLDSDTLKQIPQLTKLMVHLLRQGGVDIEPFKDLLEKEVCEKRLRESGTTLGVMTLSIPKLQPLGIFVDEMPAGKVHEYLMASAYLPFFKAEERRYVDGWFVDNMPLDLLLKRGPFEQIYLIRSHSGGLTRSSWNAPELTVITPSREVGRSFDLSPDKMKDNLLMGYYDTLRILRGYAGRRYVFKDLPDLKEALLGPETIQNLHKVFSIIDHYHGSRYVHEELIPGLARALGLGVESSYQAILLELLETGGSYLQIDPNALYDLPTFLGKIREELGKNEGGWSLKEKVTTGVARYTWGWIGDLESLVLAFLEQVIKNQGR